MKTVHSMVAALGLAFLLPASVDAAQGDPEVIIYRFPGVQDDGGNPSIGIATVFHCTNFSGETETLRFVVRTVNGTILANLPYTLPHLVTQTLGTHTVAAYPAMAGLGTGPVNSGTVAIAATSTNIVCAAMTIDAGNPKPTGIAMHGIRFNPVTGSQE